MWPRVGHTTKNLMEQYGPLIHGELYGESPYFFLINLPNPRIFNTLSLPLKPWLNPPSLIFSPPFLLPKAHKPLVPSYL